MESYPSLDELRASIEDQQLAQNVNYIIRRSTKHFGDDGK